MIRCFDATRAYGTTCYKLGSAKYSRVGSTISKNIFHLGRVDVIKGTAVAIFSITAEIVLESFRMGRAEKCSELILEKIFIRLLHKIAFWFKILYPIELKIFFLSLSRSSSQLPKMAQEKTVAGRISTV